MMQFQPFSPHKRQLCTWLHCMVCCLFVGLLLTSKQAVAQNRTISGTVTDLKGAGIPGANIVVKGSSQGAITDATGAYSLSLPDNAQTLIFSFIGYVTQEITVDNRSSINVQLAEDVTSLSEVVVTGYSTQQREDITGAVAVVDVNELKKQPVASVEQALQGRVAGVQVSNDGAPGGGVAVRVRGVGTLGNNDPLYIIDGVPTRTGLNQLNPNDIESIQVLKDASSAAIYGSRAGNGVVIITTKKGKAGQTSLNFDAYYGVQTATNLPDMLSPAQFANVTWQAQQNAGQTPSHPQYGNGPQPQLPEFIFQNPPIRANTAGTDWFDELFNPAPIQNYNLSLSGGSENRRHAISASYFNQEGILKHTNFNRYTVRANTEYKFFDRLTIGQNLTASYATQVGIGNNAAIGGVVMDAYRMPSIVPVYDENGSFAGPGNGLSDANNPVATATRNKDNKRKSSRLFGNLYAELEPVKNLFVRSDFGVDYNAFNFREFAPRFREGITQRVLSELNQTSYNDITWTWGNTARYMLPLERHSLNILAGMEAINNTFDQFAAGRNTFLTDDINFRYLGSGEGQQLNNGFGYSWSLFSVFSKLDYVFDNKYLLSATIRRDGSSRFGDGNKYATFPAFSAGWRLSQESFMESLPLFSDLKLRAAWGQSGNQEVGNYASYTTYGQDIQNTNYDLTGSNSAVVSGYSVQAIGNPDVKWETTTQTNFGLDMGFFENRLLFNADYFIKNTTDVLVRIPRPALAGEAELPFVNTGEISNKGLEFALSYAGKPASAFQYSIGANVSAYRNQVISLGEGARAIPGYVNNNLTRGLTLSRTEEGKPIAYFWGYEVEGIFQDQGEVDAHAEQQGKGIGRFKYRDITGDGVVNSQDRTMIGNPHPDFTYGINATASYKNFDLTLFFQGVQGVDVYNFGKYHTDFAFDPFNKSTRILDSWTPENRGASLPQLSSVNTNDELRPSTYFIEDGSYLRLKNLQIGYTLPAAMASAVKASNIRVYLQSQNLFTITGYSGMDPEVSLQNYSDAARNLDLGVDRGVYPNARSFIVGLNIGF
jgi:TonB-dependent starch-binding outer membrane protein SusC